MPGTTCGTLYRFIGQMITKPESDEEEPQWIQGRGKAGNFSFCQGKLLLAHEWNEPNPKRYRPDLELLRLTGEDVGLEDRFSIKFDSLHHVTHLEAAKSITATNTFTGSGKYVWPGIKLSYWDATIPVDAVKYLFDHVGHIFHRSGQLSSQDANDFPIDPAIDLGSTLPFINHSPYGNYKFKYTMEKLFDAYANQFGCGTTDLQYRAMGTFRYKREIMHVVLVHPGLNLIPEGPRILFNGLLQINEGANLPVEKHGGDWIWRPQRTAEGASRLIIHDGMLKPQDVYRYYGRWEHLTFAFYVKDSGFTINNPSPMEALDYCNRHIIPYVRICPDPIWTAREAKLIFSRIGMPQPLISPDGWIDSQPTKPTMAQSFI